MIAYVGSFVKDDGTVRRMYFAKLEDIEQAKPGYLNAKTTGTGTSPTQEPGKELVWDLQANNFRVFNYNTQRGEVTPFQYDENNLV
mgnify:FL=1